MQGFPDGTFQPQTDLTRAQVAVLLFRLENSFVTVTGGTSGGAGSGSGSTSTGGSTGSTGTSTGSTGTSTGSTGTSVGAAADCAGGGTTASGPGTILYNSETATGVTNGAPANPSQVNPQNGMSPTQLIVVDGIDAASGTFFETKTAAADAPSFSPDGSKQAQIQAGRMVVLSTSGQTLASFANAAALGPQQAWWSANGNCIAFQGSGSGGGYAWNEGSLYVGDLLTGNEVPVRTSARVGAVRWLSPGGLVYFGSDGAFHHVSADLKTDTALFTVPGTHSQDEVDFDLSPDGSHIVWSGPDSNGTDQIFSANLNGSGVNQLTANGYPAFSPRFSPDGTKIIFAAQTGSLPDELWVIGADGSGAEAIQSTNGPVSQITTVDQWLPTSLPTAWIQGS
jgi:hypothetical protein